jgi:hypothetical protein
VVSRRTLVRGTAAGLAVLVAAACGGEEKPAERGGDPLTDLRNAVVKNLTTSFHVTLSVPRAEAVGDVDPVALATTLDVDAEDDDGAPITQHVRVVGPDAYLTLGKTYVAGVDPDKYIQFTAPSRAFTTATLVHVEDPFDPAGLKGLAFTFTDARRTAGGFAGTLDATKALVSGAHLPIRPPELKAAGDVVKRVPYEATVDDRGYLTSLTVRMPAYGQVPAYPTRSTFSKFDEKLKVIPPQSSEITDVTEELRQVLTG